MVLTKAVMEYLISDNYTFILYYVHVVSGYQGESIRMTDEVCDSNRNLLCDWTVIQYHSVRIYFIFYLYVIVYTLHVSILLLHKHAYLAQ